MLLSCIAFDSTAVSALSQPQGRPRIGGRPGHKLTRWTAKDGQEERGLSVTVSAVLTIYMARKQA
jgi:hypothetical protein